MEETVAAVNDPKWVAVEIEISSASRLRCRRGTQ